MPFLLLGLGALALLALDAPAARAAAPTSRVEPPRLPRGVPVPAPAEGEGVEQLIRAEAARQGLDPRVALVFADLESSLDPSAIGDRDWALKDGGARYRRLVLDEPRFAQNPARLVPEAWASYGLFGLLAPYHAGPLEHPHVLLDPRVNAERGIAHLRRLLQRSGGSLIEARRRYVGCPPPKFCEPITLGRVDGRFARTARKWGLT